VLTAVEDFLVERADLEFLRVPCIFGLGFVFSRNAVWAADVTKVIAPLHESPLLERLESNRIDLFLRVNDPLGYVQRLDRAAPALIASLQGEIEALQGELARLRLTLLEAGGGAST
jgi:hypothetical protein